MKTLSILFLVFCWILTADAAEIKYTFQTLDITALGQQWHNPIDINDKGQVIVQARVNEHNVEILYDSVNRCIARIITFDSGPPEIDEINLNSINSKGQIVGGCSINLGFKSVGFIRQTDGSFTLIDVPGADGTFAYDISDDGKVIGQFFGPFDPD